MNGKSLATGVISLVGLFLIYLAFAIPVTWWVLAVPGLALIVFQALSWVKVADGVFILGDFIYYLGIGGIIGVAGAIVDNSEDLSLLFADNETRELHAAMVAAEAQFAETGSELEVLKRMIADAEGRVASLANEPPPVVQTDLLAECLGRQLQDRMLDDFTIRVNPSDRWADLPRLDALVNECDFLANPRHPVEWAIERRDALNGEKRVLDDKHDAALRERDRARNAYEAARTVWFNFSEDLKRLLLLEVFPCLLMIGVAIKLGKTSKSIKTR